MRLLIFVAALAGLAGCASNSSRGPTDEAPIDVDAGPVTRQPGGGSSDAAIEAARETSCEDAVIWYPDGDGDGFGAVGSKARAICGDTSGFAKNDRDCADEDPLAFPGQTAPQTQAIVGATTGPRYDFNCDGVSSQAWTGVSNCDTVPYPCTQAALGWTSNSITTCGAGGTWVINCRAVGSPTPRCVADSTPRPQMCL